MAISSGLNIQKVGITLLGASFVHDGATALIPPVVDGDGTKVFSQGNTPQPVRSVTQGAILETVDEAASGIGFSHFASGKEPPQSYIQGALLDQVVVFPELQTALIVEAEQPAITPQQSFVHSGVVPDNVELDIQRRVIVEAESPIPPAVRSVTQGVILDVVDEAASGIGFSHFASGKEPPQSFLQGFTEEEVAEEPEGERQVIVTAEQPGTPQSTLFGGIVPDNVQLDILRRVIVDAEAPQQPQSFLGSALLEAGEPLPEEYHRLITAAEPSQVPQSFLGQSVIIPDVVADQEGQGLSLASRNHEAERQIPVSTLNSGVIPDDVAPPVVPEEIGRLITTAEPSHVQQPTLFGGIVPDDIAGDPIPEELLPKLIVQPQQPLPPPQSVLRGPQILKLAGQHIHITPLEYPQEAIQPTIRTGITPDNVQLDINRRVITTAEKHPETPPFIWGGIVHPDVTEAAAGLSFSKFESGRQAISVLQPAFLADEVVPQPRPEELQQLITSAEPTKLPESITFGGIVPDDVTPPTDVEELRPKLIIPPQQPWQPTSLVRGSWLASYTAGQTVFIDNAGIEHHIGAIQPTTIGGIVPDDVIPPELEIYRRSITIAEKYPETPSFTFGEILPEPPAVPEENVRLITTAEKHPETPPFLFGGIVHPDVEPPRAPEENARVITTAEKFAETPSFTFEGIVPDDVIPPAGGGGGGWDPRGPSSRSLKGIKFRVQPFKRKIEEEIEEEFDEVLEEVQELEKTADTEIFTAQDIAKITRERLRERQGFVRRMRNVQKLSQRVALRQLENRVNEIVRQRREFIDEVTKLNAMADSLREQMVASLAARERDDIEALLVILSQVI